MAHFYGTLQGNKGRATRCGTKASGMETHCASWQGAIRCKSYVVDDQDYVAVEMIPWKGQGCKRLLYLGPIGEYNQQWDDCITLL